MGTDAIGFTLALLALGMSWIAVENRQPILGVGASGLWAGFLAFILANTTAGLQWQVITILACITFIVAMLFMGFMGRRYHMGKEQTEEMMEPNESFLGKLFKEQASRRQAKYNESAEEYQQRVRHTIARGRSRTHLSRRSK